MEIHIIYMSTYIIDSFAILALIMVTKLIQDSNILDDREAVGHSHNYIHTLKYPLK